MATSPTEKFFVDLRISNPQISECVKKIHDSVTLQNPKIKGRPLAKLHVTLMVMDLEGYEEIARAGRILENQCKTALEQIFADRPITLRFKGLGHFPHARPPVIYAKLEQEGTEFLKLVNKTVTETFIKEGISPIDSREYTPHMTVMNSRKGRISKVDYESCEDWSIGEQTLTELTLHLCRANGDVQAEGFYECIATMTLPDSDETYSG